jgi:hypothetical protein
LNRLRTAALIALVVHLVAAVAMFFILRHGLETNPNFQDRLRYIVNERGWWVFGWLTWTAAAVAILYFYSAFAEVHRPGRLAVMLTAAGIAADLSGQAIEIGVLPAIAQRVMETNVGIDLFVSLHRTAVMLSGYVGNGLYSMSALILVWSTRRFYAVWLWSIGLGVGTVGLILSIAVLFDSVAGMFWTNVLLLPTLLVWLAGVAFYTRDVVDR